MKNNSSIQKIIAGCCKKRPKYQRQFVERYSGLLYAICCRYLGDRDAAKDQLQISLMKILDKINSYDPQKAKIESWISTVTINTCLTELRRKKPNILPISEIPMNTQQIDPSIIDELNSSEILALVQSLPDIYREIFNLVEIDGYSHKEIGHMLGIKESSSRARLMRSKEMLRNKLTGLNMKKSWINLA